MCKLLICSMKRITIVRHFSLIQALQISVWKIAPYRVLTLTAKAYRRLS